MTKKSFVAGFFISFIVGIPIAFIYDLIGTFVGVIIGSFVAASKKGGGAIGILTSCPIYLSPYTIPLLLNYFHGSMDLLYLAILVGYMLINIFVIVIAIVSLLVGILFGWLGSKLRDE